MRRLLAPIYAPFAALVLLLLIPLVCVAVIIGPNLAIRRETGRLCVRLMLACIGVPLRVLGGQRLPAGASIVICNHASYIDGIVLTAALPRRYTFVVQDGAAHWPLVGRCLSRMGVVFVNRKDSRAGARTTRELMRRLHNGESLAVFAEGTFKAEAGLLPFKLGAFLMAARCSVPTVAVAIRGSRRLYGGGRRLPRWQPLTVEIGATLQADGKERDSALRLRDATRHAVLALCGEPDRAAADNDGEEA